MSQPSKMTELLPTPGYINKWRPAVGEAVYAMKDSLANCWLMAEVMKKYVFRKDTSQTELEVMYEPSERGFPTSRLDGKRATAYVTLKEIARVTPVPFLIPVGTRVIGKVTTMSEFEDFEGLEDGYFYVGVVGGAFRKEGCLRYLVFFDMGHAEYVPHEECFLVAESSKPVCNDVHPDMYDFIRHYINRYPSWPLERLTQGQICSVELNGRWWLNRVLEVDGSIALIHNINNNVSEWIFRGSPRLKALPEDLLNYKETQASNATAGKAQTKLSIKSRLQKFLQGCPGWEPTPKDYPGFGFEYHGNLRNVQLPVTTSSVITFTPHDCNQECVTMVVFSENMRKLSPLIIPLLFGWKRNSGNPHLPVISYTTPCGLEVINFKQLNKFLDKTNFNLSSAYFSFDPNVNILRQFVPKFKYKFCEDISLGKEPVNIECVNGVDDGDLPQFDYIPKRVPGKHVDLNAESVSCCDCTDNCRDRTKCACWKLTDAGVRCKFNYTRSLLVPMCGYKNNSLTEVVHTGIFECNDRCKCRKSCSNRVIQNGVLWPVQIFKSGTKGWGLRALYDMPRGSFICLYAGELLTSRAATKIGQKRGDVYMAELNFLEMAEKAKMGYESNVIVSSEDENDDADKEEEEEDMDMDMEESGEEADKSEHVKEYEHDGLDKGNNNEASNEVGQSREELGSCSSSTLPFKLDSDAAKVDLLAKNSGFGIECRLAKKSGAGMPSRLAKKSAASMMTTQNGNSIMPISTEENDGFSLKKYLGIETSNGDNNFFCVDGHQFGNAGRFINHSCSKNVFAQNVFLDTHDLRFPQVSFFTKDFVAAGTELFWDYEYKPGSLEGREIKCHCMTPKCKGRLL